MKHRFRERGKSSYATSIRVSLGLVTAAGAIGLATGAAAGPIAVAQAPPRACNAEDMAGTRNGVPLKMQDPAADGFPRTEETVARLVSAHRYAAVIDESLATREATPTKGSSSPVTGSVLVTGPTGLALARKTKGSTVFYAFKAPAATRLRFQVTWQQEVSSTPGSPVEICAAAAPFDISVVEPKLVRTRARFVGGYRFALFVLNQSPPDARPVTAILRVRRGSPVPPPASGRAASTVTFNPLQVRSRGVIYYGALQLHFGVEGSNSGATVRVDPDGNFPPGTQLRFGFSVELRQGGHRVGGMRSGVVCRRVRIRDHTEPRCKHPGFAARP